MSWLTFLLASLRSGPHQGRAERAHGTALGRLSGARRRTQRPTIEALEDRLCLSPDLLICSSYDAAVMRYNGTTGAFLGAFVPPGYGNLSGPAGLLIGPDGNLLVDSNFSNEVARYNSTTGAFMGAFIPAGYGG